ncbi:MAG TPA: enoyl-CoA hydratase-related protein [Bacteroidia bacterium]|nr:enoyl-CoA hydratase-related protein [Bacteroidia bacterium]
MNFITFSVQNGVGKIILNRPDVLNSFIMDMAVEMQTALDSCASDKAVRAILITGAGRAFCAGQDLAAAIAPGADIKVIVEKQYNPIILKIRNLEKPVVCAVNGVAAGAGANIAFACDIILSAVSASYIQAFSKIGLVPDSGGTFFLPRLVGLQRATALVMLGDKVTSEQALQFGLIYKVLADDQLMAEADKLALQLAQMPTKGLGLTKRLLNASLHNNLEQQLTMEGEMQAAAAKTYDNKEGVQAFLEKRKPVFKGE